jgi:TPR repeat protein
MLKHLPVTLLLSALLSSPVFAEINIQGLTPNQPKPSNAPPKKVAPTSTYSGDESAVLRANQLQEAANAGDTEAQYQLAMMILKNKVIVPDKFIGIVWLALAARDGHPEAKKTWQEFQDKMKEFEAAEKGDVKLKQKFQIDTLFVDKKFTELLATLKPLTEQGDSYALFVMGTLYLQGEAFSKDEKLGYEWMKKSADQGFKDAQFAVGAMLLAGKGTTQNKTEAIAWLNKAAEQGSNDAKEVLDKINKSGK